jgi:integrase
MFVQVLDENSEAFFNFIHSLGAQHTRESYRFCLEKFLSHYGIDLLSFLKLPQQDITNLVIRYIVDRKISRGYKKLVTSSIKQACEINDIVLNWKKIKKFISSEKTGNETNGRDRGYTHEEIKKILDFVDQRIKTAILILASTGMRIGALRTLRVGDLEKVNDTYKIKVYSGDVEEEYITFCTPESAKEIDFYLDFRKRHGEKITDDSFLFVKKFNIDLKSPIKGKRFKGRSLQSILEENIRNSGLRKVNPDNNRFKRQTVPILHGFRKFFSSQLVEADLKTELRWLLEGHNLKGNDSNYVRVFEKRLQQEYEKAINHLTINEENRLKKKIEVLEVEKSKIELIAEDVELLKRKYKRLRH